MLRSHGLNRKDKLHCQEIKDIYAKSTQLSKDIKVVRDSIITLIGSSYPDFLKLHRAVDNIKRFVAYEITIV